MAGNGDANRRGILPCLALLCEACSGQKEPEPNLLVESKIILWTNYFYSLYFFYLRGRRHTHLVRLKWQQKLRREDNWSRGAAGCPSLHSLSQAVWL